MIGSSEGSVTVWALKWLNSSVFSEMSCEFVGTSEFPAAALPTALVWFFTSVGPLVSLEVRALGVNLVTARIGAAVHTLVSLWGFGIVVDSIHDVVRVV